MTKALIVRKSRLPQRPQTLLAAQYVRMSTDYQKYSIENQAATIAAYAQAHNLTIIHTYRDEGESGLRFKNRLGLRSLIDDVRCGRTRFDYVLVYDVSRWGRFQDIDESAHYEFLCRQAGLKVAYCAEQFENDGSLVSNIVKNIKRVMAAEFSRELGVKIHAGASRLAGLGYKMGGTPGFGLERIAVDQQSRRKGKLEPGERKYLGTDHVRLCPGSPNERKEVRWIFDQYIRGMSQADIIRNLNQRGVQRKNGLPWTSNSMSALLRNECYVGNLVWNRVSQRLGSKRTANDQDLWVRKDSCIDPIIDQKTFLLANKLLKENRAVHLSEDEMLIGLRKLLFKKGKLNISLINSSPNLPSASTYYNHFGTFDKIYQMIGYDRSKYWTSREGNRRWIQILYGNAETLREMFIKEESRAYFNASLGSLQVNDDVHVNFGLAKWRNYKNHGPRWPLVRLKRWPNGWVVGMRLTSDEASVLDYVLLSTATFSYRMLWMSANNLKRHNIEVFPTFDELARSLIQRILEPRKA